METERVPLGVQMLGVMQKERKKLFVTSVLWSDQSEVVVYRSFREFKSIHKKMKKAFPSASKVTKSNRDIPRFRDKKLKQSSLRKGADKNLMFMKFLQKYCDELLKCEAKVTQSSDFIQFLTPKESDLHPDVTKNGIMIMPSGDEVKTDGGVTTGGNVTTPFVTETYQCVAAYETKDTKNKPFKVEAHEKLDVLIKDKAGWWLVEKEDKRMAWFPAPYLVNIDEEEEEQEEAGMTSEGGMLYTAVRSYKANKVDEISVNIGAVVEVLQKSVNGWWLVRYSGKVGYIPTLHLQPYNFPHTLHPHQQDSRPSSPSLLSPTSLQLPSPLSLSSSNLRQPSSPRSPSPTQIQPDSIQRSRSLEMLSQQTPRPALAPPLRFAPAAPPPAGGAASPQTPLPTITVEMDEEPDQHGVMLRADSRCSFISDSSDLSFSDDSSSFSDSSSLNLDDDTQPRPSNNLLSPDGRLMPSISDPNLYKGPKSPKVPPRPRAQDILSRCTTITRKNAAKGGLSLTQTEVVT